MATERFVSPVATSEEERRNWSLRPGSMREYIGQSELVERLRISITACRERTDPLGHILLHGPPGLGKTTLAYVIAKEMGSNVHVTSGPALTKGTDLVATLQRLEANDILFIDEIHRLPIAVEEFIYPAMEDYRIDVSFDAGLAARTVQITLKPFTLIGATTRAGLVSAPMRSRFGLTYHLRYYETEELLEILVRSCGLLSMRVDDEDALRRIASRSRGTPRIANRLLRWVRDYAQVEGGGEVTSDLVDRALVAEGIDELGLDNLDRAYLMTIAKVYGGGPAGLEAVAASMNEDSGTLEDVVEPYLLQIGFLARTRRGRMLTKSGADHLGVQIKNDDDSLFNGG